MESVQPHEIPQNLNVFYETYKCEIPLRDTRMINGTIDQTLYLREPGYHVHDTSKQPQEIQQCL